MRTKEAARVRFGPQTAFRLVVSLCTVIVVFLLSKIIAKQQNRQFN